jgi:hypothetical protein
VWLLVALLFAMLAQSLATLLAAGIALGNVYTWRRFRQRHTKAMAALAISCTLLDLALVIGVLVLFALLHAFLDALGRADWGAIQLDARERAALVGAPAGAPVTRPTRKPQRAASWR